MQKVRAIGGLMAVLRLSIVIAFGSVLLGCGAAQSPPGPRIEPALAASAQYTVQLERVQQDMLADLDQFVSLRTRFLHGSIGLLEGAFPLELFRFVLMSCLNDENPQQMSVVGRLTCQPRYYDELVEKLAELPVEVREQQSAAAQEMLGQIDALRMLYRDARARIVQMPQMIRTGQAMLEDQRVELRRVSTDLERRRQLYRTEDWEQIQESLEGWRRQLSLLEDAIEALTLSYPEWTPQLDAHVTGLYMDLAGLRSSR